MTNHCSGWLRCRSGSSGEAERTLDGLRAYYFALGNQAGGITEADIEQLIAKPGTTAEKASELAARLIGVAERPALLLWRKLLQMESWMLLKTSREPCAEPSTDDKELRVDVALLLAQVVRLQNVCSNLGKIRTHCCGIGIVAMAVLLYALMKYTAPWQSPETMHSCDWVVIGLLGAIGGLTSSVTRLYAIDWRGPDLLTQTNIPALKWGLLYNLALAALEGAVFACVLIAFFMAGFVKTELFPQFDTFPSTMPASAAVCATGGKIVVWSFVAGFSERLLPDLLSQLTKRATSATDVADLAKVMVSPARFGGASPAPTPNAAIDPTTPPAPAAVVNEATP